MSDWLTYSPISGHGNGIITITANTLSSLEDRVATIIVSNSKHSVSDSVLITQHTVPTAITFNNVVWATDVPATGGIADKNNCSYEVIALCSDGARLDITSLATVSGNLDITLSSSFFRENVGTLNLTATYDGLSASTSVSAYQAAPSITGIEFTSLVWAYNIPASGGTATKDNCKYTIYAYYETSLSKDITDVAVITGSLEVPATTAITKQSVGTLYLTASYDNFSTSSGVTAYQKPYVTLSTYLTFEIVSDGIINWVTEDQSASKTISYSKNGGVNWVDITSTTAGTSFDVSAGDIIMFKGNNTVYGKPTKRSTFNNSTAYFNVLGNIMSLIDSNSFSGITSLSSAHTFSKLFMNCNVLSAEDLLLPATILSESCYEELFFYCYYLTTAPELPATTLAPYCYDMMFVSCEGLTKTPDLPATTLAPYCYAGMFDDCTGLVDASHLVLPATTLSEGCYLSMFLHNLSLTKSPTLPASTLVKDCYNGMFGECPNLRYIKCLATDISASNCTSNWVNGVDYTGTFVKNSIMTGWTTGFNGIPNGWVTEDYTLIPTAITFNNLTWAKDVPASGGTATKDNCTYEIIAKGNDGILMDVTALATVSGSLNVSASTVETRHSAGTLTLTASYSGFTDSDSIDVYQEANITDYSKEYLTLNISSDGVIRWKTGSNSNKKTISYSKDNGITWTNITSSTGGTKISVSAGDKIKFKGDNESYNGNHLIEDYYLPFTVEGNIMSLIDSEGFATATTLTSTNTFSSFFSSSDCTSAENLVLPATTLTDNCYQNMFRSCSELTTPPSVLPATTLATNCYDSMFYDCSELTTAPELPANTLAIGCYKNMFRNCTKLTTAPELPATTLATNCYEFMFDNCTSLTIAPELPATTLANNCCHYMFRGCTSLTTAPSILPATTLVNSCYLQMFMGCTSLTKAPELPATTLAERCYNGMFDGCTSLNYIKCLATDISATYCTSYWVDGVASTGTFIKNPNMTSWTTGPSGIPKGWTVIDAT